jgi:chemotaxis family two-component system sensor kinase Cph1
MNSFPFVDAKNVDLTNCDREQIQFSGAIMPHGVMLVVDEPEMQILQASLNVGELLGIPATELVGSSLRRVLSADQFETLNMRVQREDLQDAPVHAGRMQVAGRDFDLLAHRCDQVLILELELRPTPSEVPTTDIYSDVRAALAALQGTTSVQSFLELAVAKIKAFTGLDRVMAYKFMEDGSGWVRSEAVNSGLEPYLGLHYPPSDIPAPARRLFARTWVRHQPDIGYRPVPLYPENNPKTGGPLDLSSAFLRSVSVMYVDYLKNMGARSSMVMTLLKDGKLWGLIACHHHSAPKHIPYEARMACEFLAHMVSLLMSSKEDLENQEYRLRLKSNEVLLVGNLSRGGDLVQGFISNSQNLLRFLTCEGAAVVVNDQIYLVGATPSARQVETIVQWLAANVRQDVFSTDCLSSHLPGSENLKETCAGLLAVKVSKSRRDFLLWFRPEKLQTVNWAGDPGKPVDISSDGQRLLPRTSFALWQQSVELKSAPWTEVETEAVEALRAAIRELVLVRAEETVMLYADLERSHADLNTFAYAASHDLKEPLRGIQNLSEMIREEAGTLLSEENQARLAGIGRLSNRMNQLIESLLEYSRAGRGDFMQSNIDMNLVVADATEMLQERIAAANAVVEVLQTLPVVNADRMRMVEVYMNLIANAVKYNQREHKRIQIGFTESDTAGRPVFFVRDNGIGIDAQYHEQIFEIFTRLHDRDKFGGGSGAGLTIVSKVIERHKGRIWLESEVGTGTTFFFVLGEQEKVEEA